MNKVRLSSRPRKLWPVVTCFLVMACGAGEQGMTGRLAHAQTPVPAGRSTLGTSLPTIGRSVPALGQQDPTADQPIVLSEFAIPSAPATTKSAPGVAGSAKGQPPEFVWLKDNQGQWTTQLLLRRVVKIDSPVAGTIQIAGHTPYQVFCNGRTVGEGDSTSGIQTIDVSSHLRQGDNVIAVQSKRETANDPGIGLRFQYSTPVSRQSVETDTTWMAARRALPLWKTHLYSDRNWDEAAVVVEPPTTPNDLPMEVPLPVPGLLSGYAANQQAQSTEEATVPIKQNSQPAPADAMPIRLGDELAARADQPDSAPTTDEAMVEASPPETTAGSLPEPGEQATSTAESLAATETTSEESVSEPTESAIVPVPDVTDSPADPELMTQASQKLYPITPATKLVTQTVPVVPTTAESSVAKTTYNEDTTQGQPTVAATSYQPTAAPKNDDIRLRVPENFIVEPVASSEVKSLIAIEFDEFGRLIASKEEGGLIRIDLTVPVGDPQRVTEICDQVSAVQGILPLNGQLYVTGLGPDGLGLYKLSDQDNDFLYETVEKFCGFTGDPGEHGPHAINLGPDRMLYVMLGNHSQVEGDISEASLIQDFYEGDLLPRYEDPSGHAVGLKAPGGTLIRMSLDGSEKEIVAGGIRNAYDFAFNKAGDIFFHDSDMESDEGTSWYRPTALQHLVGGADYGWRSGWAKWRGYYLDSVPPIAQTGRSSPAGCAYYQHVMFPEEYRDVLFLSDWSNGRIISASLKREGARYTAKLSTFMEGRPLNVTDIAVGPEDGALYVALGGRGSTGGIYRVRWSGPIAKELTQYNNPWEELIRAPLFYSAATRQRIATLKQQLAESWDQTMYSIITSEKNVDAYRLRGLDVLQWFGPTPTIDLLGKLSTTQSEAVRAKAATILGTQHDPQAIEILIQMMSDDSPWVQRCVCESLGRLNATVPVENIVSLLDSSDRSVAYVASRLLQKQDVEQWRDYLEAEQTSDRFARLALALLTVEPNLANAYAVLVQVTHHLDSELTEIQTLDLLRVTQLALARGQVEGNKIPAFRDRVAREFPADSSLINRELIYILTYLKTEGLSQKYSVYLGNPDNAFVDRLHLAMHSQLAADTLSPAFQRQSLEFLEQARTRQGGGSFGHYVMQAARNLAQSIPAEEAMDWIARGDQCPDVALVVLKKIPRPLDLAAVRQLGELDEKLGRAGDPASKDLRLGIVAVLGEALVESSIDAQVVAAELLETIWEQDPNRRQWVAIVAAQCPIQPIELPSKAEVGSKALQLASEGRTQLKPVDGKPIYANRFGDLMINSLSYLGEGTATDVLECLAKLEIDSKDPTVFRNIILLAVQYPQSADAADRLLSKWTGENTGAESTGQAIARWQSWFQQRFQDQLPAVMPGKDDAGKWTIQEIEKQLELLRGDAAAGQQVFVQAQCASCHKIGNQGNSIGPDLNVVAGRFTRREILQAIVHPSQVISDQYRSTVIETEDGKVRTGIVTQLPGGKIALLDSEGKRTEISKIDVAQTAKSNTSIMPNRLLEPLNAQQVVDLIHFLEAEERPTVAVEESAEVIR